MHGKCLLLSFCLLLTLGCTDQDAPNQGDTVQATESESRLAWPTSLFMAVFSNHRAAVEDYLAQGESIDQQSADGATALILAANLGHADIVRLLISEGANLSLQTQSRQMTFSVNEGQVNDILVPLVGGTALHEASDQGHLEVVKLLVEAGADIEAETSIGAKPLHVAATSGHAEVVRYLVSRGLDIDGFDGGGMFADPGPPIYYAAWAGHSNVIETLAQSGANVEAMNAIQDSPLMVAARRGKVAAIRTLLKHGASVNQASSVESDMTPLLFATERGHAEAVSELLKQGADINAKTSYGQASIDKAASMGYPEVFELLLNAGADRSGIDINTLRENVENDPALVPILELLESAGE